MYTPFANHTPKKSNKEGDGAGLTKMAYTKPLDIIIQENFLHALVLFSANI